MTSAPTSAKKRNSPLSNLSKCPTGIQGLDEITFGGLPAGRPTLICGGPGCGKTLFGMEFLARGAMQFNEPGVCISFEETAEDLTANVASLGFDLKALIERKKLAIDHVVLERSLVEEAGEYDLEALFVRIGYAAESIGAKRILLDSIESLFAGIPDESILRSELRRLFHWLKDRKLTAVITAERGERRLTRYGLEEYISDCVIQLEHRVTETVLTRRLRVVKYRGSSHGTNEYPFLIDQNGISVLPLTSLGLSHPASVERISSGVPALDTMLAGEGFFRGSSILISGTSGTGKTSLTAHFIDAACASGERCVYFSFEESGDQIVRNMSSIGIDLGRWIRKGLLRIDASRPTTFGLEMHLVAVHKMIREFQPSVVAVDPITALLRSGSQAEAKSMLLRLIDFLKAQQITAVLTTLTGGGNIQENTEVEVSSIVDAWLLLRDIETGGERNRGMYILKARGLAHSNQIREFLVTGHGVELRDVYLGEAGVLTGSARVAREARDTSEALLVSQEIERKQLMMERKRKALDAQIALLRLELETEEHESKQLISQERLKLTQLEQDRTSMAGSRGVGPSRSGKTTAGKPGEGRK